MVKYIDDKGLKRFAGNVDGQINNARYSILKTKGKANGIASLDSKGFVPLDQLGNLDMTFFEPVQELPTSGIKKHIYLIKNEKEGEQDTYDEYIYTGDIEGEYDESKWEKLGDFVPTFDLKEYAKKSDGVYKLGISQTEDDGCEVVLTMSDGSTKKVEIPLASALLYEPDTISTQTAKPWTPWVHHKNGLMSGSDKEKLDKIDTEALSQSITNANTAADNTNAAISACKTATEGAEKVNAELTDENVINITDRNGAVKSTDLSGAVKAADDISRIKQTLGSYSDREDIVLSPTETDKAISADGVKVTKKGWSIAEFTAELGNEYLFKPGVIDSNVCIFAECIDKTETRAIDYQYTYTEDGKIATATATYNGKTYTYTYDYSGSDTVIIDQSGSKVTSLPTVYTTTIGSYNVLTRLNADAELPEDGYCRFVSNFQVASSIKVAVSYKADSADLNMKVVRDGMTASMCTQLSKINKKVDDIAADSPDMYVDICSKKKVAVVLDGKVTWIMPHRNYRFSGFSSMNFGQNGSYSLSNVVRCDFHYKKQWEPISVGCFSIFKEGDTDNYIQSSLSNIEDFDVSGWNTSKMTNFGRMFANMSSVKKLDVSGFDTSKVTNMNGMFAQMNSVTSLDVSGFDTSKVTNMSGMFWLCSNLKKLDVSGFDTSKVTSMNGMFYLCYLLTSLDVSGFDTSKVTDMGSMFSRCGNMKDLNLSNFDMSNVTNIKDMFLECANIESLTFGEGFGKMKDETNALDLSYMSKWKNDSVKTLLNLYDRAANGLGTITIKLHANTKAVLGEDGIATLTSKGYVIA